MKVHIFESADWPKAAKRGLTQELVITAIERGLRDVGKLLPRLSKHLNIGVYPGSDGVMPEYGVGGHTYTTEFIAIRFDALVPHGPDRTLESIYQTVFHEANHAARWNMLTKHDGRFIASVPFEGLATVFEREYAGYQPLYGQYGNDATMQGWFNELRAANWEQRPELFFRHPDGRRWIGYKVGTWLVDRAVERSGKTVIELTGLPADEILALADVNWSREAV